MWRVGHRAGPLDFVPREFCGWQHRWDDPRREYRTLYCAAQELTALREVLADLRPNAKAVAELRRLFGDETDALRSAGAVDDAWRSAHVLAPATVETGDELCDLDADVALRRHLERSLANLLAEHGMDHLDITQTRSRDRIVTQTVSRELFDRGYAGVAFGSNLDDLPCFALFEGRAILASGGEPVELARDLPVLVQVCREFGLRIV